MNAFQQSYAATLASLGTEFLALSTRNGFWDTPPSDVDFAISKLCLIHAEVSELVEAIRKDPTAPCPKVPEITLQDEEAADIFIRLLDFCAARGIDLGRAVALKHEFNKTRPYRHGKQA